MRSGSICPRAQPQRLTETLARDAGLLVTMGCGEKCPWIPGLRREDWPLADPKGLPIEAVREIRDEVKRRVLQLIREEHCDRADLDESR